jgi:UDP-glucose 4-epimerase
VRDYIHVSDLAEAHVLALRRLCAGGETACFNLGTGEGYSVNEVVAAAQAVTGRAIKIVYAGRRPGDPPALVADRGAFHSATGWQPRRSALRTQIEDAWRWHRGHFGHATPVSP